MGYESVEKYIKIKAINLNNVADAASVTGLPAKFQVKSVTVFNASKSLAASIAQLAIYDAAAAGGNAVVAATLLTSLSSATKVSSLTVAFSDQVITSALYIRNTIADGSAATVDIIINYFDMT